jgi:hypothetical protein
VQNSVQGMMGDAKRQFTVADMMPASPFLTVMDME